MRAKLLFAAIGFVLGALLTSLYCYFTFVRLPSSREPFDPYQILPHESLTIIDQRSGVDSVENSDLSRLYSPSPFPRSALHGVPLARV